tara:strand:+ start:60 stop:257 length:198 start_codon:yes stop_codon:yes gene_type:complete
MNDTWLEHVFVNFSKRSVKLMDNEGFDRTIEWQWNKEGAEGFAEIISAIQDTVDHDMITYCFAEQ